MPGYANRIVTITFPELTEEGDPVIHVVMRNPKLVPPGEMRRRDVKLGPDGEPDADDAMAAAYEVMAKLIIGWLAYDATSTEADGDQARLTLPATAEQVGKLPLEILNTLAEQLNVNPQTPTASPEAGTSRT
jgi:hypothetical protein